MGIDEEKYEVGEVDKGDFHIRMLVLNKHNGFKWNLINVYGAAHSKDKIRFLLELVKVVNINTFPIVMGGDFNIVRKSSERNKASKSFKWSFLFNAIIEHWSFKGLEIAGARFTWSNNQLNPLLQQLDRILVSLEWERKFPMAMLNL